MSIDLDSDVLLPGQVTAPRQPSRQFLRRLVSMWLLFHAGPSSSLRRLWHPLRIHPGHLGLVPALFTIPVSGPRISLLRPQPAESTLLAYEAHRADGTVVRGRIPDRRGRGHVCSITVTLC